MALEIFGVACKAVLKVFLIAAVGCWARRKGVLDARTATAMAKVNGTVFLPCLLFVALGRSVTIDHLRNVWLLPLAACVNISMGGDFRGQGRGHGTRCRREPPRSRITGAD